MSAKPEPSESSADHINRCFEPDPGLPAGLSVLNRDEWLRLSAFTDNAMYFKPSTETKLREIVDMQDSEPMPPEFTKTIQKYRRLSGYCRTFQDEIMDGTREVASNVIFYAEGIPDTFAALTKAIRASQEDRPGSITVEGALAELSKQWQSSHPSPKAAVARGEFKKYVDVLRGDAEERRAEAEKLQVKLKTFQGNLKESNSEFVLDAVAYEKLFGATSPKVKLLVAELARLQEEMNGLRKQESDMVIVLETAPLYLLIPFYGYYIMSGVLVGVGAGLGALRKRISDKIVELEFIAGRLGPLERFMELYEYGQKSTRETVKDIELVLPLVARVEEGWRDITSRLTNLSNKLLGEASARSLTGNWDVAVLRLNQSETAWRLLKVKCEEFLRFQLCPAKNNDIDDAMNGVKVA